MKRLIVGITGASGVIYALRLLDVLNNLKEYEIHLTISDSAERVFLEELGIRIDLDRFTLESLLGYSSNLLVYHHHADIAASIASGSFRTEGMIIAPCSMATVGSIAAGLSRNLVQRAADVCIKERRKLVLVPRETPLSTIHLENMLKLSQLGVSILPAMPGFYHMPKTVEDQIDFVITKLLDQFGLDAGLIRRWKENT